MLEDLESVDPVLYRTKVEYIRDSVYASKDGCTLADLCLDFEMAARSLDPEAYNFMVETNDADRAKAGDTVIIKRTSSGNNALPVTEANKMEFLDLFVKHMLVEEIQPQIDAFRSGLGVFCGADVCEELRQCCTPTEVQLLLCGVAIIDVEDWKRRTEDFVKSMSFRGFKSLECCSC